MDCGIKMWIKCKQKPVKVPANWCEKTNRMWAWVCSWHPNEHVYAKKILCICTHPMQRIDVCYDSQRLVREREIPIPWPPQKPEQTTKIPQKSCDELDAEHLGVHGGGRGCVWTDLSKSTTADALSGFHMRTDDLHPTRKCSQNRCGKMDVPRSKERGSLTWA